MANGFLPPPSDLQGVYDAVDWPTVLHCLDDAHRLATKTYYDDGYFDNAMFGTVSANALASRLREAAELGELGVTPSRVGDRWSYRSGRFELHFHRVGRVGLVPITGEAAKKGARVVTDLGPGLFPGEEVTVGRHLVVAIVSSPEDGVDRVSLIELVRVRDRQAWGHIYAPLDVMPSSGLDYGDGSETTPPEEPTTPMVTRTAPTPSERTTTESDQTGTTND